MRLIHITDAHLTSLRSCGVGRFRGKRLLGFLSWYLKRRYQYRPERLAALTEAIANEAANLILVTGDLVHIGLREEIASATRWLEQLASIARVMLVPGNHDIYTRDSWAAVASHWVSYFGTEAPAQWPSPESLFPVERTCGDISLIGLSSACPTPAFLATGHLGPLQRERLAGLLEEQRQRGCFRCLLIHHPPLPGLTTRQKALTDAPALAALLQQHGAELVLHGHVHRNVRHVCADGLRVYGTASASSAMPSAPAAYRRFDIEATGSRWGVRMAIKTVTPEQGVLTVEEERWNAVRAAAIL